MSQMHERHLVSAEPGTVMIRVPRTLYHRLREDAIAQHRTAAAQLRHVLQAHFDALDAPPVQDVASNGRRKKQ